jgi:hypothetical protein
VDPLRDSTSRPADEKPFELRLCEIRGRFPQNLIRAFQLEELALEILHPLAFVRRQAGSSALVRLNLADQPTERFHRAAECFRNGSNRRPL